jgi:hypothetical protein
VLIDAITSSTHVPTRPKAHAVHTQNGRTHTTAASATNTIGHWYCAGTQMSPACQCKAEAHHMSLLQEWAKTGVIKFLSEGDVPGCVF